MGGWGCIATVGRVLQLALVDIVRMTCSGCMHNSFLEIRLLGIADYGEVVFLGRSWSVAPKLYAGI